jgi:uncharacterized protein YbjT (DUF2867 family)
MKDSRREVFISGATRYVGSRLIPELLRRGHLVRVLVRSGSEKKLPQGCAVTVGDVLNSKTFMTAVPPAGTLVHLVGVPSPAPWKVKEFRVNRSFRPAAYRLPFSVPGISLDLASPGQ